MNISRDLKIMVVGTGKVGTSIIQAFAQSGFKIWGIDIDRNSLNVASIKIQENLEKIVSKGKINSEERTAISERISLSGDFDLLNDADVVIEAVFEKMEIKKDVFRQMDQRVRSGEALLLTNTSSLSVSEIASVTKRPEKVAGMHFFNPVPVMKLVEVVRGILTAPDTIEKVKALARLMGKTPIVSADSPGFIVNRMLNALTVEATRIVGEGVGTVEDVDIGARLGLGHPMGPFELFDYLNAIHLLQHATDYMSDELGDRFRLPVWVKNLVRAGKWGKDYGRGFYDYSQKGE
jgi:3-hydroxybutyryl-CoA dehydrogenase